MSPRSDIRFFHLEFLIKDLEEYYHLNVINVSFGMCISELLAYEVRQKMIISKLPLINFRRFHFLKNNFQKSCKKNIFSQKFSFSKKKIFENFEKNFFLKILKKKFYGYLKCFYQEFHQKIYFIFMVTSYYFYRSQVIILKFAFHPLRFAGYT